MSVKMKSTRTRAPNFTKEDQILLLNSMKKYTHIIECKQPDSVRQADKQSAWLKVTEVFNANSASLPRTTENLICCYRNIKTKIKKQHSDAKTLLDDSSQKVALISAILKNGKDWDKVASTSNWQDPELCQIGFEELQKETKIDENQTEEAIMLTSGGAQQETKIEENQIEKAIMRTGGVPPQIEVKIEENETEEDIIGTGSSSPQLDKTDSHCSLLKKIIEPQLDGIDTINDSDASLMSQYQESISEDPRIRPIEAWLDNNIKNVTQESHSVTVPNTEKDANHGLQIRDTPFKSQIEILSKKKEVALLCKKNKLSESFKQLSEAKLELVKLQKQCLEMDIEHKKKMQEIELEEIIKENKFKHEMRERELMLLDIKIKNAQK